MDKLLGSLDSLFYSLPFLSPEEKILPQASVNPLPVMFNFSDRFNKGTRKKKTMRK